MTPLGDVIVCPGCRAQAGGELRVRALAVAGDWLACDCGRRFPIVDGVPLVLADPAAPLRDTGAGVLEPELPPALAALLAEGGPDDHPYAHLLEHLSIYLDAHWGDRAIPPRPSTDPGITALAARIASRPRVERAVELGCSAGRVVAALAATADHVTGLDLQFAAVRRARRILDGHRLGYARRVAGRHYTPAWIEPGAVTAPPTRPTLLCADALDPPLAPARYDRVVALSLLDSVASPRGLLAVMDGLCRPGGELVLASPFTWQGAVMADAERIGGPDPAAELAAILRDGAGLRARYTIEETAEIPWVLRRDARSQLVYQVHYLRARQG
jgi:SAM-dependent methyltransferase